MHRTTLHYDETLLREAVRAFCWRVLGFRFFVALGLTVVGLSLSVRAGDASWLVGVLSSVLVLGIGFGIALYVIHHRNVLHKLRAMGSSEATLEASESAWSLSSGAGTASLPWSAIDEVWRFNTYWLLVLSKSQFVTLPLAGLPAALQAFILAQVRIVGGKVDR